MKNKNDYLKDPLHVKKEAFIPHAEAQLMREQGDETKKRDEQSGKKACSLTSKDLTLIEDLLTHEAMAFKKCTVFAGYFQDQALVSMAAKAALHHKQHFGALETYMNQHS